jgi:hypothetical protein
MKNQVIKYISNGDLKGLFAQKDLIKQSFRGESLSEFIVLEANYNLLKKDLELGLITREAYSVGINRILYTILNSLNAGTETLYKFTFWQKIKYKFGFYDESIFFNLIPFYTSSTLKLLTDNYIPHYYSRDDQEEAKFGANRFILKYVFSENKYGRILFVLGGTGVGKTSIMLKTFLSAVAKNIFEKKEKNFYFLSFGQLWDSYVDDKLESIRKTTDNLADTVLFLDALDEDIKARNNFESRVDELIEELSIFSKVVISCRNQYFTRKSEKDYAINKYLEDSLVLGKRHNINIDRLYLHGFNSAQIYKYFKKNSVEDLSLDKIKNAIAKNQTLFSIPMICSFLKGAPVESFNTSSYYQFFEDIFQRWIEREALSVASKKENDIITIDEVKEVKVKTGLNNLMGELARYLFFNNEGDGWFTADDIENVLNKYERVLLSKFEGLGKSFVAKNNIGQFSFIHSSVFDYFLAKEMVEERLPVELKDVSIDSNAYLMYKDASRSWMMTNRSLSEQSMILQNFDDYINSIFLTSNEYGTSVYYRSVRITELIRSIKNYKFVLDLLSIGADLKVNILTNSLYSIVEFYVLYNIKQRQNKEDSIIALGRLANTVYQNEKRSKVNHYSISISNNHLLNNDEVDNLHETKIIAVGDERVEFYHRPVFEYFLFRFSWENDPSQLIEILKDNRLYYVNSFFSFLSLTKKFIPYMTTLNGFYNKMKPLRDLTRKRLEEVTELFLCCSFDVDLTMLKLFPNLNRLSLYYCTLLNIDILKSISQLREVNLVSCRLRELDFLEDISNYVLLNLTGLESDKISVIQNNKKNINWISAISKLDGEIKYFDNHINDHSFLKSQKELINLLIHLKGNEDLSWISNLEKLESLSIHTDEEVSTSSIGNLANLEQITLYGKGFKTINSFKRLKKLRRINLISTDIKDLSPIFECWLLDKVSISDTPFQHSQIKKLKKIPGCKVSFEFDDSLIVRHYRQSRKD